MRCVRGAVVKNGVTESVGGVVMMPRRQRQGTRGEPHQGAGGRDQRKNMLPDGLKIVPYYDRSELVDAALDGEQGALRGIALVVVVLFLFLATCGRA